MSEDFGIFATVHHLRKISLDNFLPFSLKISEEQSPDNVIHFRTLLRCLPGKRLACIGNWQDRSVFAKLFIDPKRAKVHWQRDLRGVRALSANKILTPNILTSGFLPDQSLYYCFFECLDNAQNVQEIWEHTEENNRHLVLGQLIDLLAKHHRSGIMQNDLHLNNFLLLDNRTYTLDGADIYSFPNPLGKRQVLNNLAAFFAQFFPANDGHIENLISSYPCPKEWKLTEVDLAMLRHLTKKQRTHRKREFLQKIKRECSQFVCTKTWSRFSICLRDYATEQMRNLLIDPDRAMASGQLIKKGNSSTVVAFVVDGRTLIIKRYNIKNFLHALSRAYRPTRAYRSWYNANKLCFYGIPTPKPIAFLEYRRGFIRGKAYFISEFQAGDTCYDYFTNTKIDQTKKTGLALKVAQLLNQLKALKISHGDLKASNILLYREKPNLIDLDGMKEYPLNCLFKKSWNNDRKRFLKNWTGSTFLTTIFEQHLQRL